MISELGYFSCVKIIGFTLLSTSRIYLRSSTFALDALHWLNSPATSPCSIQPGLQASKIFFEPEKSSVNVWIIRRSPVCNCLNSTSTPLAKFFCPARYVNDDKPPNLPLIPDVEIQARIPSNGLVFLFDQDKLHLVPVSVMPGRYSAVHVHHEGCGHS